MFYLTLPAYGQTGDDAALRERWTPMNATKKETLAAQFDPRPDAAENTVKLPKAPGMKYLVITAKHHDGFALFDSRYNRYDIMDASPHKQDIIEVFYNACKKYGIDFGIYYSHNIDWADGVDCGADDMKALNDAVRKKTKLYGLNNWDPSPNTFEK